MPEISIEELQADVQAYIDAGGNRSAAAKARGLPRMTFNDRLKSAEIRLGIKLGKVADGRIEEVKVEVWPLPAEGKVNRYIFTSIQNNTYLHPAWTNLKAYADWLADYETTESARFSVGTYSYALDAYGAKAVKRGAWKPTGDLWYAPEVTEYILDTTVELAPGLVWCGEMNILPTTRHPLSGLETYHGRKSNIVPHAKVAMESVPSMAHEGTKFNWSTGTITQRNYIQKQAGIKAEDGHCYAGILVEVDHEGNWWVRQLHIDANGTVYDVGPSGIKTTGGVRISGGQVIPGAPVEAITWGDIHTAEMEPWVRDLGWGKPAKGDQEASWGMLDWLHPKRQVMHDIFSMRSRGHHEMKDFHALYTKHVAGQESVEGEIKETARFLTDSWREWCETVVVPSNHDRHLDRWLNDEDPRKDPLNARYHMRLQHALLESIDRGAKGFNILEWALREQGVPQAVHFLVLDQSYVICREIDGGIECALHGDLGPNGARGSTRNLAKLGRAVNKGHDHTAAIRDKVYSTGACSLSFAYMKGPGAHSISHIVTFENGTRQIVTMWEGRWRA